MELADLGSTAVRTVDLQSADREQMAAADMSMRNRTRNWSADMLTVAEEGILGLRTNDMVAD